MRKLFFIASSIICIISLCSCKKDYDKLIEGEWELDKNAFYEIREGDTCYSEVLRKSNDNFTWSFYEDGNITIGKTDTNELIKYAVLIHFSYDSLMVGGWNSIDTKERIWPDIDRCREQVRYTINCDSLIFSTDSLNLDKCSIVKLNRSSLILEGHRKNENLVHFEFKRVGYNSFSYIIGIIFTIIFFLWLSGYLVFRIGRLALFYRKNPLYQNNTVVENTEDAEEETEELLNIKRALIPNVRDFIKSERGKEELSSMGDGLWQSLRESRTMYRKISDNDLFMKKDEEKDWSDENWYRLPDGKIPFDGGVIVLPQIYEFISSKGKRRDLFTWLQSEEGVEWQRSANGIVWVRDVVFNINFTKFMIWGESNNGGSYWHNLLIRMKDMFKSLGFWCAILAWSIIYLVIDLISVERYSFMEGLDFTLFTILFLIVIFVLFDIFDYLLCILIRYNAIKNGERFMKRSTIYYKDFANRVNETNKKNKVYQRDNS